jgi:Hint domain
MADSFTWISTGSGDWNSTGNWLDVTTGTQAVTPPGPADVAEIDNPGTTTITITGPASVLDLSASGQVTLAGSFAVTSLTLAIPSPFGPAPNQQTVNTSTIALAGDITANSLSIGALHLVPGFSSEQVVDNGITRIDQGAVVSTGPVTLNAGDLVVDGGSLSTSDGLTLGTILIGVPGLLTSPMTSGSLDVTNHGNVYLGSLAITDGSVNLDATSTLEIGNAGTATAGTITVDPGASINDGAGIEAVFPQITGTVAISGPVLNNGTIYTIFNLNDTINNGTIVAYHQATLSSISGNGQLELADGCTIGPNVSGTVDMSANQAINIALGPGVPVDPHDTPVIDGFGPVFEGSFYALNTIVVQGITADTATFATTGAGIGTLTLEDGDTPVASLALRGTYASDSFVVSTEGGDTAVTPNHIQYPMPCFAAGTRIATSRGEVAVETLSPGETVNLASGGTAPVVWIGRRRVDCRSHPKPNHVWPVRIRRGAFAPGLPHHDLFLSPDHAVFTQGVLIPVKYLVNGDTIRQVTRRTVVYFHLELPAHDVVLAGGLPVESYLDTGDRHSFENAGDVVSLFPAFSFLAWEACGYAPLIVTGPTLDRARHCIEIQTRQRGGASDRRKRRGFA